MTKMELLDNPIWHALTTNQKASGFGNDHARRYRPDVAPFVAIERATPEAEAGLLEIVDPGEKVGVLGVAPEFGKSWKVEREANILQMVFHGSISAEGDSDIQLLTEADIPAMVELTGLVYPAYFRPGTARLGAYFGIYRDGQLCAMAGERMGFTGHQEVSAVCTHPDHRGRGHARRLINHLVGVIVGRGDTAFLHGDDDNEAAIALYRNLDFKLRRSIPFWVFQKGDR